MSTRVLSAESPKTSLNLPEGYSLEKEDVGGTEYTILCKEGKRILMLPSEHCPFKKIQEVVEQTRD